MKIPAEIIDEIKIVIYINKLFEVSELLKFLFLFEEVVKLICIDKFVILLDFVSVSVFEVSDIFLTGPLLSKFLVCY